MTDPQRQIDAAKAPAHPLLRYCAAEPYRHMESPFTLTAPDGSPWVVATNGRLLVATRGHEAHLPPCHDSLARSVVAFLPDGAMHEGTATLDLEALRAWAGTPTWPVPVVRVKCPECEGEGVCPHCEQNCPKCGGSGALRHKRRPQEKRPGRVLGILADRVLLARALDGRPGATALAWVFGDPQALLLDGGDWRVAVCALADGGAVLSEEEFEAAGEQKRNQE